MENERKINAISTAVLTVKSGAASTVIRFRARLIVMIP
jgi:hypothetical protein